MNLTVEEVSGGRLTTQPTGHLPAGSHLSHTAKVTSIREFTQFFANDPGGFFAAVFSIIMMLSMATFIMRVKLHITTKVPLVLMFLFIGMGFRTAQETYQVVEFPSPLDMWSTVTEVGASMVFNTNTSTHSQPDMHNTSMHNKTVKKLPSVKVVSNSNEQSYNLDGNRHPLYVHVMIITKPFIKIALSAVGLQIGSHLNRETLQPILIPIVKFLVIFTLIVMITMNTVSTLMFPGLHKYGRLIGAIALERSSPEALAGIVSSHSSGPFTSVVMCIAAVLDVLALVCYVCAGATIGSSLSEALMYLAEIAAGTIIAALAAVFVANITKMEFFQERFSDLIRRLIGPVVDSKKDKEVLPSSMTSSMKGEILDGDNSNDQSSTISVMSPTNVTHIGYRPYFVTKLKNRFLRPHTAMERLEFSAALTLIILIFVIPFVGWFIEVELLIAAVSAGIALNYRERHPLTDVLEKYDNITNLVLFTFMGHRIVLISYLGSMWPALIFFTARLFSLWAGSFVGGTLAQLPSRSPDHQWHHHYRWMALITQLAIALSLVHRMEEEYPETAPIARAYGGAVLLAVVIGPPALQMVLRIVGEDNNNTVHKQELLK